MNKLQNNCQLFVQASIVCILGRVFEAIFIIILISKLYCSNQNKEMYPNIGFGHIIHPYPQTIILPPLRLT